MSVLSRRAVLVGATGVVLGGGAVTWALAGESGVSGDFVPAVGPSADWRAGIAAELFVPPLPHADALYAYDPDGVAHRVDVRTGAVRWSHATPAAIASAHFGVLPVGGPVSVGGSVPVADSVVVGGSTDDTRGTLLALDAESGAQRWRHDLGILPKAALLPGSDVLVAGDHTGRLVGLDAGDGSERWHVHPVPGTTSFNGIDRIQTAGDLALAVYEYEAGDQFAHVLLALDRSGRVRWSVDAGQRGWTPRPARRAGPSVPTLIPWTGSGTGGGTGSAARGLVHLIRAPWYARNAGIDAPGFPEELLACRLDTGERVWSVTAHRIDTPIRRGDTLYVTVRTAPGRPGQVRALDAATGVEKWRHQIPAGRGPFSTRPHETTLDAAGDTVCVGDPYGFVVLDARRGTERWSATRSSWAWLHGPLISGGRVYVAESDGRTSTLRSWRLADGRRLPSRSGWAFPQHLVVTGRGLYLATVSALHAFALPLN